MKNILITGISGYLGTRLTEELAKRHDIEKIVGIDISPPHKTMPRKVLFFHKDIRDPDIGKLLVQHQIDTVLHLAFVVKPIHDLKRMHDIDANGTQNILEQTRRAGVSHLIAISSTLAYGAHADNPKILTEEDPLRGNKTYPYGFYKAETDRMMQAFAQNHPEMAITILRPCTVFGPNIDNYVSRMLFLPVSVSIKGHDPAVQLVHENDFVDACLTALEHKAPGAFNIAGEGTLTVKEIAAAIGTRVFPMPAWFVYPMIECLWRIHFPMIEVNRGYLDYVRYPFVTSNKKARQILNFTPRYSSQETLAETIRNR
ncbi:MAG: NAD-dependent epimerase/dehydratase family protein [Desulfobacteraceae bacterium]|jgi:UDP-glucose 4-epimerase|nr:NAD-dependent epimerase/dehydratase family protein [Desulfobacteraceae bacterium]